MHKNTNLQIPSICTHQTLSKYLEKLIGLLALSLIEDDKENLEEKLNLCRELVSTLVFKGNVEVISKNVFGSHVLQTLLQCITVFQKYDDKLDELLQLFASIIEERCLFELLHHNSGSHVLRTLLKVMANVVDSEPFVKNRKVSDETDIIVLSGIQISPWRKEKLLHWSQLWRKDLVGILRTNQACATVCLLLKLFKHQNLLEDEGAEQLVQDLVDATLERCMYCKNSSFALETCIGVCGIATYSKVHRDFISPNLQALSENIFANYAVQAFIQNTFFQESHLRTFIEELQFERLFNTTSSSIIWRLAEACVRVGACESLFVKKVFKTLAIEGGINPWVVVISTGACRNGPFGADSILNGDKPEGSDGTNTENAVLNESRILIKAAGCSILLHMLKFPQKSIQPLLDSFRGFLRIATEQSKILDLACDRHFSRVLQLLLDPKQGLVSEKIVKAVYDSYKDQFIQMANNLNGGFVISSLYTACTPKLKIEMLETLLPQYDAICARNRKLVSIIKLDEFKENQKLFVKKIKKGQSIREMFKDLITFKF
ncbi:hypothetical protein BEWA_003320 [Theileria equi strain WA]|uniref:Uncharacterized protein n=1 Tax=Theileria equi strain WA TaxID=1537102 RepID=L0B1E4_THEEQ|nr:hypothetical protein BEWA_003320 [Theileria equi strain WA]AFZ80924.1 hypothetical protein BEWA_003320 [Theileria equi strain WA]|eukprot:XP_004830590.1 hypothetical protein BEWA_003320 [Theileria equi strain WA]